jgi:hypothetical protein
MKKNLKPVPADKKKSLGKLPQKVRNKMGFMSQGGLMKKSGTKKSKPQEKKELSIDPLNLANPKPKLKTPNQPLRNRKAPGPKPVRRAFKNGGEAKVRGMGSATQGGKFKGVF